jgi:uncharacterized protein YigA (DUF484 family)
MDLNAARAGDNEEAPSLEALRQFIRSEPEFLRGDPELLAHLGLKVDSGNVIDFGHAALARVHAAHRMESDARQYLETTARENFAAQAQTHGAVIDLLESRNHADLARRVEELAQRRFGLLAGALALEGPGRTPAGWRPLAEGQVDLALGGVERLDAMGFIPTAHGLFRERGAEIGSVALVRVAIWEPARQGLLAFASADPEGFTPDMGTELVSFLARVVERTAERWPVL